MEFAGQVVVFALEGEEYALPVARVQEIIRHVPPRSIGSVVPWVRGVISLRGRIVPVCDLAERLGHFGAGAPGPEAKIVIVETTGCTAGVVVDGVSEVLTLAAGQVEAVPAGGIDFQLGLAKVGERLVIVLDPDLMLAELAELDAAAHVQDAELLAA